MKVAFFLGSLNRGGTETLILDVFKKRANASFDMILLYRNEGELSDEYRITGVPMIRLKPNGSKIGYFLEIKKLLKREKVDILHAQTLTNALIGIICTSFSNVKLVFTFHGLFTAPRFNWIRHLIIWRANAIIFVSKFIRDWYYCHTVFCPRGKCHVVYNGIDSRKMEIRYPVPDFLDQYESEHTVRLSMVGNFVSGRSQIVVCKALKLLRDTGTAFQFFFVGGKKEQESWLFDECVSFCKENGLSDCVHFVGSRGDVPAILQHIDGFVYSTKHDTFGISVIEAVMAGVPTLTNDWAVMKEISNNWEYFDSFISGDDRNCCVKIQELINNIDNRKEYALMISSQVKEVYSINNHINLLGRLYQSLYSGKRK